MTSEQLRSRFVFGDTIGVFILDTNIIVNIYAHFARHLILRNVGGIFSIDQFNYELTWQKRHIICY